MTDKPTKEDLDQVPVFLEALRAVAPSVPPVDEAAAEIAALKAKLKEAEEKRALLDTFVAEKVIEAFDQCIQIAANAAWYPCTPTEAPYNRGLNSGAVSMRQEIMAALLKAKFDLSPSSPRGDLVQATSATDEPKCDHLMQEQANAMSRDEV